MSANIVSVDEEPLKSDLRELVRKTVQETLNALLDEEANEMVGAERYERTAAREAYRSGHYKRKLVTTGGEVVLDVPKLRGATLLWLRRRGLSGARLVTGDKSLGMLGALEEVSPRRDASGAPSASAATSSAKRRGGSGRGSPRCSRPSMRRNRARRRRQRRPRWPTRSSR